MLDDLQQRFNILQALALLRWRALAVRQALIVAGNAHVTCRQPDIARLWIAGDGVWPGGDSHSRVQVAAGASIMPFQVMFTCILANTVMQQVERLFLLADRLLDN